MTAHSLAEYLTDCRNRRGTGAVTPETSLYTPLETLLTAAGHGLKPHVVAYMSLKNQAGNMPDGGLFTPDQIAKGADEPPPGQVPARGVVECKKPKDDVLTVADTTQVSRYWDRYEQVLVTNYREFLLLGRDDAGKPLRFEYYRLADTDKAFWALAANPDAAVAAHGDRLLDFLRRCLRRPAPLSEPKDVAWFLASYARDARGRVEHAAAHAKMETVRKALEDALGLKVTDAKGERFFRSTLVQTLFYGLFAAWVFWHRKNPPAGERFAWQMADRHISVPVLRKLFRELSDEAYLTEWDNLTEVMHWAADTLNRVDRPAFFAKFTDAEAVQYFYEPFLEAFDPDLRKQLGVWYTPPEVVRYMVARVDQTLRDPATFNRPLGLASDDVYVLDPCCGTGAYLVEVLARVAATLKADANVGDALAGKLKQAAKDRVFGFEILPAPFAVAHLQIGLFLQDHGTRFEGKERAGVYLTNALTGWLPPTGKVQKLLFDELEQERAAADKVKRTNPIIVVLGNPPYNGFAGLPADEEAGLVEPYRATKTAPKPQGQGLNDLYVRFLRIAERCVTERHDKYGLVCYISNYSWLDGLSHTGLRERFLAEFDRVWIDSLNGDKYKTGKLTPDGQPDPSAFSTPHNREGIQVGTAVVMLARHPKHKGPAKVRFRDFWGEGKRAELEASGAKSYDPRKYRTVTPVPALGLPFRAMTTATAYTEWPLLTELFPTSFSGVQTKRDDLVVDIDLDELQARIGRYFDKSVPHEEMARECPCSMRDTNRFEAQKTREYLVRRGCRSEFFVKLVYRPFDVRWVYWEPETRLLGEKSPSYFPHVFAGNPAIVSQQMPRREWATPQVCTQLGCLDLMDRCASFLPLLTHVAEPFFGAYLDDQKRMGSHSANLSDPALGYLNKYTDGGGLSDHPHLFHHVIAVLHAPAYATENASALRQDWPRVPLPATREALVASADLGRRVAALLDPEAATDADRTAAGIGVPAKVGGGSLGGPDYVVAARWGSAGKGGITMPGPGKAVARAFTDAEAAALGPAGVELLGPDTLDVYLNGTAFWRNVPRKVWDYHLGGYQVLKKWLSYREEALLGRPLTLDEVGYLGNVARRIAALRLLGPALDANYAAVKAAAYPWPR